MISLCKAIRVSQSILGCSVVVVRARARSRVLKYESKRAAYITNTTPDLSVFASIGGAMEGDERASSRESRAEGKKRVHEGGQGSSLPPTTSTAQGEGTTLSSADGSSTHSIHTPTHSPT